MSNPTYVNYRKNGCQYMTSNGDMIMRYGNDIVMKDRITGQISVITEEMRKLGARAIDEHPNINMTIEEYKTLMQKGIITLTIQII